MSYELEDTRTYGFYLLTSRNFFTKEIFFAMFSISVLYWSQSLDNTFKASDKAPTALL